MQLALRLLLALLILGFGLTAASRLQVFEQFAAVTIDGSRIEASSASRSWMTGDWSLETPGGTLHLDAQSVRAFSFGPQSAGPRNPRSLLAAGAAYALAALVLMAPRRRPPR